MVRAMGDRVTGAAGGERDATARRTALRGLAAALSDLPAANDPPFSGAISIRTTSPDLAEFGGFLESLGQPVQAAPPDEDLDLWARIATAAKGRRLSLIPAALDAGAPTGFAAAWADLALDKAKRVGSFATAIPKPNLAKIPGLDRP